jgi:hypothetical protein
MRPSAGSNRKIRERTSRAVRTSRSDLGCTHAAGTIPAYCIAKLVARRTEICPGPRADGY